NVVSSGRCLKGHLTMTVFDKDRATDSDGLPSVDPGRRVTPSPLGLHSERGGAQMPDMPRFVKWSPEIVERFGAVMDRYPDVERRKMFGYPAAFVGGNMATGLFAEHWVVRLSDAELATAISDGAAPFEVMPGRPM